MHEKPRQSETTLVKGIGKGDFLLLVLNGTIGAGILGLPSKVYEMAGSYSYVAYVAAGLCMLLIMLSFAEVASRFNKTGGAYLFATTAFGSFWGFSIGWLTLIARMMAFATLCSLTFNYLQFLFPVLEAGYMKWFAAGIIFLLALINYAGIRSTTVTIDFLTYIKLGVLVVFIVSGLSWLFSHDPTPPLPVTEDLKLPETIFLLIFAFAGFEATLIPAGEIKNPSRTIPFGLVSGLVIVSILYLLIQAICMNVLPSLPGSEKPLADASSIFLGTFGAGFLAAGAVLSLIAVMHGIILVTSRLLFAMAEQKHLPAFIGKIHPRFRVPHIAILITAILSFVAAISGGFIYVLSISTGARLLTFLSVCASLPLLRKKMGPSPYHLKTGIPIAITAMVLTVLLFFQMNPDELKGLGVAMAVGLVLYGATAIILKKKSS